MCLCVNIYASMSVYVPTVAGMCTHTLALIHVFGTAVVCVCVCVDEPSVLKRDYAAVRR